MAPYCAAELIGLPDELMLEILSHLQILRSFQTQSQAFRNRSHEKSRQCENHQRQKSLHALSLTCRHLNRIATPLLYSAFLSTASFRGLEPLPKFYKTIKARPALAQCVVYAENRLSDYLGNGLYDDLEFYGAVEMVQDYFLMLGLILRRCSNLEHMTAVSLETSDVSFWKPLLLDQPQTATHGFSKLRTLALQLHTEDYGLGEESTLFPRIYNALESLPALKELRASGVVSDGSCTTTSDKKRTLETIDITECILDLQDVLNIASSSTALRHFNCSWAYLNSQGFNIPDLLPILMSHKTTLESFLFDAREVRFNANDYPIQCIGSLHDFTTLRTLSICETSFLNTQISILDFPDQHISLRISELLPKSLERFTLFLRPDYGYDDDTRIDEVFALWALAEDCADHLPNLKIICLQAENNLSAPLLTREFREKGIDLMLIQEVYES